MDMTELLSRRTELEIEIQEIDKELGVLHQAENDIQFADPDGESSLRAVTRDNPRNLPCPVCGEPDQLTPKDRRCGYQCDACAEGIDPFGE